MKNLKQRFKRPHERMPDLNQYCLIQTSFSNREDAEKTAKMLVEKKMAACVQISSPITSYYYWKGALQTDQEYLLSIKTLLNKSIEIDDFLHKNHSYETPEIVTIVLDKLSDGYKSWIDSAVN